MSHQQSVDAAWNLALGPAATGPGASRPAAPMIAGRSHKLAGATARPVPCRRVVTGLFPTLNC
jgi:hypothetical protein